VTTKKPLPPGYRSGVLAFRQVQSVAESTASDRDGPWRETELAEVALKHPRHRPADESALAACPVRQIGEHHIQAMP